MQKRKVSLPLAMLMSATRGILGIGLGLLLAERLRRRRRRKLGAALAGAGALSTIPLAIRAFSERTRVRPMEGLYAD
ncbi:MAG: hypothetical protein HOV81_45760 [Kofleriaceae bacterium]|nr:hypothetical protein [Kofleriaceae bacterium]